MRVNEIFYSLQGEGYWMGRPAVFVRLSGCNLKCPFCDTEHETYTELTEQEIIDIVTGYPARHIVITGGEPTLQLSATLVHGLKRAGFYVQIETNGSIRVADEILACVDWVTCSPKDADMKIGRVDELKVIFQSPTDHERLARFENDALQGGSVLSLQPCDVGDAVRNREIVSYAIEYVKAHPAWRLSLQTHKLLDIR
jgi:organic radical activating enzyme